MPPYAMYKNGGFRDKKEIHSFFFRLGVTQGKGGIILFGFHPPDSEGLQEDQTIRVSGILVQKNMTRVSGGEGREGTGRPDELNHLAVELLSFGTY